MKACKHCLHHHRNVCLKHGVRDAPKVDPLHVCPSWTVRPHSYKLDVICPYCGEENAAVAELKFKDGESKECNCILCKKIYTVTAQVAITYTTETRWESNIQ